MKSEMSLKEKWNALWSGRTVPEPRRTARRLALAACALVLAVSVWGYRFAVGEQDSGFAKPYTYEELACISENDLLNLFLDNGLVLDEGLNHLTRNQLSGIFKQQFDLLIKGMTSLNYSGYQSLADSTRSVYEDITGGDLKS